MVEAAREKYTSVLAEVERASCFVPFIGGEAESLERKAIALKRCLGFGDREPLDARRAAEELGVPVVDRPEQFASLTESLRRSILTDHRQAWSAATIVGPLGPLIVVNYTHSTTRLRVTLAEEIAHLVLGHPPSTIDARTGMRTYKATVEEEAFGVGGALVMPYAPLFNLVKAGTSVTEIAEAFCVSEQLANCRLNRAGLRRMHRKRRSA